MNTTTEILSVDGVVLNTLAKNIESLTGRLHTPEKKGENVPIPGAVGELYVPGKMDAANTIVLPMWVRGCTDDGLVPSVGQDRINFYANLDQLTGLFGKNTGLLDVRHTLPDTSIRQCFAEVLSALDFSTIGRRPLGRFSVEMTVPDAYWQDLNPVTAQSAAGGTGAFNMAEFSGLSAPVYDAVITVTGPMNAGMVLTDNASGETFQFGAAIPAGQNLVIDCDNWTVKLNGVDSIQNVQNTHDYFLPLTPDVNGNLWVSLAATGLTAASKFSITGRRKYRVG